jgi:hypothetical protein
MRTLGVRVGAGITAWLSAATLTWSPLDGVTAQSALEVLPVQGNVHLLASSDANTTVQLGPEGPLVVDTQPPGATPGVVETIRRLTPRPIRHVVLTSGTEDHA